MNDEWGMGKNLPGDALRPVRRAGMVDATKGAKMGTVLSAIQSVFGEFSVSDIQEACPAVGIEGFTVLTQTSP